MKPGEGMFLTSYTKEEFVEIIKDAISSLGLFQVESEKELTQQELLKEIRISKGTLIKWQKADLIPFFRPPGRRTIRYYKSQVLKAIEQNSKLMKYNSRIKKK